MIILIKLIKFLKNRPFIRNKYIEWRSRSKPRFTENLDPELVVRFAELSRAIAELRNFLLSLVEVRAKVFKVLRAGTNPIQLYKFKMKLNV